MASRVRVRVGGRDRTWSKQHGGWGLVPRVDSTCRLVCQLSRDFLSRMMEKHFSHSRRVVVVGIRIFICKPFDRNPQEARDNLCTTSILGVRVLSSKPTYHKVSNKLYQCNKGGFLDVIGLTTLHSRQLTPMFLFFLFFFLLSRTVFSYGSYAQWRSFPCVAKDMCCLRTLVH